VQIESDEDDSPEFIQLITRLFRSLIVRDHPQSLILIKIDHWFGSKWLSFSGKTLGTLGVWMKELTIPPFVPNRVISQRRIVGPNYTEIEHDKPLHLSIPSSSAVMRRVAEVAPGSVLVWYSGGSKTSG